MRLLFPSLGIRRGLFVREVRTWIELTEKLEGFRLGQGDDRISWVLYSSGSFSTKSQFLTSAASRTQLLYPLKKKIWNFKIPRKVNTFLWSLAHRGFKYTGKIATKVNTSIRAVKKTLPTHPSAFDLIPVVDFLFFVFFCVMWLLMKCLFYIKEKKSQIEANSYLRARFL